MTMEWNSRNNWLNPNGGNSRSSFREHDEYMSRFRRAHANVAWTNKPKRDELARLDSMLPLQVPHPIMKTGGSRFPNGTADWSALVPALKVARYKISQN